MEYHKKAMMTKKLKPVHPGEILREGFMVPLGLSMNKMAMALRVPVTRIADIVNERRGVTADTALRFARYFDNSAAFWMNLQIRASPGSCGGHEPAYRSYDPRDCHRTALQ